MNKKSELKRQMHYEAELLVASFEWAENQLRRLIYDLEQAEDNYDFELSDKIEQKINLMLARIANEDKNVEKFVEKYGRLMNEKEKSLFNPRKKE
jgi:hypothetical protein